MLMMLPHLLIWLLKLERPTTLKCYLLANTGQCLDYMTRLAILIEEDGACLSMKYRLKLKYK
jgi:hypothetical protein